MRSDSVEPHRDIAVSEGMDNRLQNQLWKLYASKSSRLYIVKN